MVDVVDNYHTGFAFFVFPLFTRQLNPKLERLTLLPYIKFRTEKEIS